MRSSQLEVKSNDPHVVTEHWSTYHINNLRTLISFESIYHFVNYNLGIIGKWQITTLALSPKCRILLLQDPLNTRKLIHFQWHLLPILVCNLQSHFLQLRNMLWRLHSNLINRIFYYWTNFNQFCH